ncbi:MAG: Gfo/Idh/MocA family oxidoreductase [Candidatus Brocadiia bacterium]|jgi:predicted dehydrogenase|nr:Gfo/Idh/MocA family oxidoreductase [Candidatus Brocadiia bacterium]
MARKLNFGVIGCGGIARGHVKRLLEMPECNIVALMDTDRKRLSAMKKAFPAVEDVREFDSHKAMIRAGGLHAVVICSPHVFHYRQIVDSLRAGLHVLTEKPMVCSIAHAKKVMEEEEKAGKVLAISYQRHAMAQFQFIRNAIAGGAPGKVKFISALQGQEWLRSQKGKWRQVMDISCGGQLNDSGSHLIDIILWMTGLEPAEVSASIDNSGREVDINSALSVRFKGGALGAFSIIGSWPGGFWEEITITCERWNFLLRNGQLTYTTGTRGELHTVEEFRYGAGSPGQNFVEAIRGRAEVLAPSICGLRAIQLTEAAWKSGATGKPAKLR